MQDHINKDLNLKLYHPKFTNKLLNIDTNQHCDACCALLDHLPNTPSLSKVLFTDECVFYHSTHDRNAIFWAKENLHFMVKLEHNPPHVILWAGMTAVHLICSYFFDGPVNTASYAEMLEIWLIPQVRERGLMEDM
jgi:hypothetical protein